MAEGEQEQDLFQNVGNSYLNDIDLSHMDGIAELEGMQEPDGEQQTTEDTILNPEDTGGIQVDGEQQSEGNKKNKEDPSSDDINKPSPFTPYAKLVKEEGVLPNFDIDTWDGKPEGLIQGMQSEINNGIKAYKESFDPRVKWLADNIDNGVAFEDLLNVDKQRLTLATITDEGITSDEALQKDIVKQYYKETTKFPDATIDKAIERLEATGDLEEESKGFFTQLKELNVQKEQQLQEQAQQKQIEQQQAQEQQLIGFKETLSKIDEIIPGVKVNTNMKDKLYKGLTTAIDVNPATGQPVNEIQKAFMENPQLETTFAYIWYATNGFKDFKVFGSTGKKAAVAEFTDAIKGMDFNQGTQQKIRQPDTDQSLVDQMASFSNWGQ